MRDRSACAPAFEGAKKVTEPFEGASLVVWQVNRWRGHTLNMLSAVDDRGDVALAPVHNSDLEELFELHANPDVWRHLPKAGTARSNTPRPWSTRR